MATKAKTPAAARPAGKAGMAKRTPTRRATTEDEILATAHALGAALYRVSAADTAAMRGLDAHPTGSPRRTLPSSPLRR